MRTDTKLIRSIDWLVGWDDAKGAHVYLRDADLVFTGDTIDFVGWNFAEWTSPHEMCIYGKK